MPPISIGGCLQYYKIGCRPSPGGFTEFSPITPRKLTYDRVFEYVELIKKEFSELFNECKEYEKNYFETGKFSNESLTNIINHFKTILNQLHKTLEEIIQKDVVEDKAGVVYDEAFKISMKNKLKNIRGQLEQIRHIFARDYDD